MISFWLYVLFHSCCVYFVGSCCKTTVFLMRNKPASQGSKGPICFQGHNVWATQRKNESKLDEVPGKTSPCRLLLSHVFQAIFVDSKGGVQRVTASQRADGVGCIWSLKGLTFHCDFVCLVCDFIAVCYNGIR